MRSQLRRRRARSFDPQVDYVAARDIVVTDLDGVRHELHPGAPFPAETPVCLRRSLFVHRKIVPASDSPTIRYPPGESGAGRSAGLTRRPDWAEAVLTRLRSGSSLSLAAKDSGTSRQSVYGLMRRDPQYAEDIERARQIAA